MDASTFNRYGKDYRPGRLGIVVNQVGEYRQADRNLPLHPDESCDQNEMSESLPLFASNGFEPIPIADADVKFMPCFYQQPLTGELMATLSREIAWRQETIVLWGKEIRQPRLSAWYGDDGADYAYSGMKLQPQPWTATLLRIKTDVEAATGHCFNSVLLNLYRNERDSVGWHSDDEAELGQQPVIASLSLGETRVFRLRHRRQRGRHSVALPLTDGSLLLMAGHTQRYWRHAIEKERIPRGPRINLTFRNIQC